MLAIYLKHTIMLTSAAGPVMSALPEHQLYRQLKITARPRRHSMHQGSLGVLTDAYVVVAASSVSVCGQQDC